MSATLIHKIVQHLNVNFFKINKTGAFVKHERPRRQKSQKLAIFSMKVMVKVTRSLILVSFERVSLVEYAWQIWSLYLLWFKSYGQD